MDYACEQCGQSGALCVSDWGYIAALCDRCLRDRKNYLKLPGSGAAPAAKTRNKAVNANDSH
ncbi:MAG TPA: hypothetical protein VHP37_30330 [Burkholderiales bacterium]|nr:hypothetical protein [Burkholderiales bacterium]